MIGAVALPSDPQPSEADVSMSPAAAPSEQKTSHSLLMGVLSVSAITVCAKVFGFGEKVAIAHYYGTDWQADAYFATMGIVWTIVFCAKELIYPSLLAVFSGTLLRGRDVSGALFRRVFLWVLGIMALAAVAIAATSPWIIRGLLPGFDSRQAGLSSWLLRTVVPGTACLGLAVVTYTCLNAHKRFAISALGDAIFKIVLLAGLVGFIPLLGFHAVGLAVGAGGFACVLFQLWHVPERKYIVKPAESVSVNEETSEIARLIKPLIIGVVFSHVSGLFDNLLASTLESGKLAYLHYGKKIVESVVLIGPVAVVTVMYSQLAHLGAAGKDRERLQLIARTIRLLLYGAVPLALLLIVLRVPIISFLFERGRFDAESTIGTAQTLQIYAMGLVTFALEGVLVYCFYAMSDTRTPVITGVIFVLVDMALAALLLHRFEHLGIAGAFVVAKTLKVIVLGYLLHRRIGSGMWGTKIAVFLAKLVICTMGMWVTVGVFGDAIATRLSLSGVSAAIVLGICGILAYGLGSLILRFEEGAAALSMLLHVLGRVRVLRRFRK